MARDWIVLWSHVYGEQSKVADWLANAGLKVQPGIHLIHNIPKECVQLMQADLESDFSDVAMFKPHLKNI